MSRVRRPSLATQAVLKVLLDDPTQARYGFEIAKEAHIATGSLYPILTRLEHELGWLDSYWEDVDESAEGRPRRRYYRLTSDGAVAARQTLEETLRRTTPRGWRVAEGGI